MDDDKIFHEIHLNLNVRGLKQSATLFINEYSNQLVEQGKKIYKLGLGQSPFPVPDIVIKSLQDNAYQKDYLAVKGLPALRQSIADFYYRHWNINYSVNNIVIGPGSKELLFLLQLVYYGELIIPTPSWVSYAPQAKIIGRNISWIPTRKENFWRLTPKELDKLCRSDPFRPRLLILNYPSNPTGYTYKKKELEELAIVAKKYKVIVVADEIYGMLDHEGDHYSISTFYPEGTILSGGLSKWCGAGGWRLGSLAFPSSLDWLADSLAVAASETFTSTSAPIQYAAVTAFEPHDEIEDYLNRARKILLVLGKACNKILNEGNLKNPDPHGGFYLFPDFTIYREKLHAKNIYDAETMCTKLLEETGVATLPGSEFGCSPFEFTLRLSYVNFNGGAAMEAAKKEEVNESFAEKYCSSTLEAMHKMIDWFEKL
jgi:aspartate aminotransferase